MTPFIKKSEIKNNWYVISAENAAVGRLAAYISKVLRGKSKSTFNPHIDNGDFVIVTNIDKIKFTGKKFNEKKLQKEIEEFEKGSKKLFISTGETTVCWRIWGKGQPIIFLHGGYGSWRHWIKQVTYLSKDYQILVPDMPGFGESSDLTSDHTPENISKNLFQTFNKLKILKPQVFFPAGGNYMIYGKFCKVNKYIAQPNNYLKIFSKFNKINSNNKILICFLS